MVVAAGGIPSELGDDRWIWSTKGVPDQSLRSLAEHCKVGLEAVAEEWIRIRAEVEGRLVQPAEGQFPKTVDFREETLLPALEMSRGGCVIHLIVAASLAISNCAEFERDMKSIREIWRKRTRKKDAKKLGRQIVYR